MSSCKEVIDNAACEERWVTGGIMVCGWACVWMGNRFDRVQPKVESPVLEDNIEWNEIAFLSFNRKLFRSLSSPSLSCIRSFPISQNHSCHRPFASFILIWKFSSEKYMIAIIRIDNRRPLQWNPTQYCNRSGSTQHWGAPIGKIQA